VSLLGSLPCYLEGGGREDEWRGSRSKAEERYDGSTGRFRTAFRTSPAVRRKDCASCLRTGCQGQKFRPEEILWAMRSARGMLLVHHG